MKKIVILLAVVALAAPAFAQDDVNINLATSRDLSGNIWVEVSYDASGASQLVRGFSFDQEVDNGAGLIDIDGYKGQGDPTDVMSSADPGKTLGYGIYLGTMTFDVTDPLDPFINAEGSPVANGPDSLSGGLLGASIPGITIECGSLYDPLFPVDAPTDAAKLFDVEVNKAVTAMTLTADEDTRGGIVMEDGSQANLICPTYMVCWGYPDFGFGNGNGDNIIDGADFLLLVDHYKAKYGVDPLGTNPGDYNPAADFNMDGTVDGADFLRLVDHYKDSTVGGVSAAGTWPPL